MTVALAEYRRGRAPHGPPRDGRTLEDVISGAWEDLLARRTATCPICGGALEPRLGSGPSPVGGRCRACASELR